MTEDELVDEIRSRRAALPASRALLVAISGQEGLPSEETVRAYETVYIPAQRVHFERDQPRDTADFVLANDTCQLQPA